eukprot:403356529
MCMLKFDLLHKQLLREQDHYKHVPKPLPLRIGDYLYYRRFQNPADSMTIYRFPYEQQIIRGQKEGELPLMWINNDDLEQVEKSETAKEFPEQTVFNLNDLTLYYKDFALKDERIKNFVEQITNYVQTQEYQPLYNFQMSPDGQIAVMIFDTEQTGKSFEIVIKDLKINRLFPVILVNTDGEVAFDKNDGIYYTQVDSNGRGHKVYRHQIGTLSQYDKLVYEEVNPEFEVNVQNTLSNEYIVINIKSTFKPTTNEIWIKNGSKRQERFWLVQPMEYGVRYQIKQSGEFLYKLSNEEDKINFKITKILLPDQLKHIPDDSQYQSLPIDESKERADQIQTQSTQFVTRLGKREIQPVLRDMNSRQNSLLVPEKESDLIKTSKTLIESKEDEKILGYEVFKHYMAVIEEKNQLRQMKIVNLKTERISTHLFDSEKELNPADGQISEFFDPELEDNLTFDSVNVKYRLNTPNVPSRVFNFNMGTKKAEQIFYEQYTNYNKPQNIQCEKIQVKMRDGQEIPLVMAYDKQYFNDESPWILFTNGSQSSKSDLQFDINKLSIMQRGICCTRYFDDNWFYSGAGERKLTHLTDFIDSAIFLREKGLTQKLGSMGQGRSGSLTALAAVFNEPVLFDSTVAYNPLTDLITHLFEDLENRDLNMSPQVYQDLRYQNLVEFGDIRKREIYDMLLNLSPYHLPINPDYSFLTDLFITQDEDQIMGYHAKKFICKLRELKRKEGAFVFYKQYAENYLKIQKEPVK